MPVVGVLQIGWNRNSMFFSKPLKEPERYYLLPGEAAGGPAQTYVFLEMVHRCRVGGVGHSGGGLVLVEPFRLLSAALDPPGFVDSMCADFDEIFPFHSSFGGGLRFQPAVARGIG